MACKVSLQSLLATLIAISVANNGNDSAQVAGRCIAYVRPATRIPSALLHVVPMPAWEQRKFVDFVEASGIRNKDNLQLESYSVSNDRGFVPQDEQFENGGTMRDADKTAYWIVEPGSFAYNPARINVGSIGYQSTRKNVIVSSLYEVFKTDRSCDDRFLWHWFKSSLFTKQIEMLQEGGVRLYFFFDKLQKSEIWMPNVDEQRIIGQQFDQLDSLITLHQRKYDKLVILKKSMLEKMFPKDGESVPEIRFAGFTDPWEQRKFSNLTDRVSMQSSDPDLPQVEYEDIVSDEGTLNKDLRDKEGGKTGIKFYAGDVLYGKLRPYLMNWLYPQFNGVAVGDFWVLRATECDSSFLYRLVQTDSFQRLANVSSGSKMPRADWNLISQSFFAVPADYAEQRVIAKSLAELDNLITLHQRKRLSIRQRSPMWS